MYPYSIVFGLGLYEIFTFLGIIACFFVYKLYLNEKVLNAKIYNYFLFISLGAIAIGYVFASLFQSFFDYIKTGEFKLWGAGITFYGGLVGGIFAYLILNLIFGKIFFKENEHWKNIKYIAFVAPICVTIAHAFGRIGCLFAGCCHGNLNENGILMWIDELSSFEKAVPVQLFEAIFLFILFAILTYLYFKKLHYEIETYSILYGVWRFIIEFFRDDDRGALFIGLSPSQGFAIIFIIFGISIILYKLYKLKHKKQTN